MKLNEVNYFGPRPANSPCIPNSPCLVQSSNMFLGRTCITICVRRSMGNRTRCINIPKHLLDLTIIAHDGVEFPTHTHTPPQNRTSTLTPSSTSEPPMTISSPDGKLCCPRPNRVFRDDTGATRATRLPPGAGDECRRDWMSVAGSVRPVHVATAALSCRFAFPVEAHLLCFVAIFSPCYVLVHLCFAQSWLVCFRDHPVLYPQYRGIGAAFVAIVYESVNVHYSWHKDTKELSKCVKIHLGIEIPRN